MRAGQAVFSVMIVSVTLFVAAPSTSADAGRGEKRVAGGCSLATALEVGKPLFVWGADVKRPVTQVLCGSFAGPGSDAMAITLSAPTCWSPQGWAVYDRSADGSWTLVMHTPDWLVGKLVAVGSKIRETGPIHLAGDGRCLMNDGTHTRLWSWDGAHLTPGAWRRLAPPAAHRQTSVSFYSPSRNIACELDDKRAGVPSQVGCYTNQPPRFVIMKPSGALTISPNAANVGEGTGVLPYGHSVTLGVFHCSSLVAGVRCTTALTGRGFLINRAGVHPVHS